MNLLHAHSHFSDYDGYGNSLMMAKRAKELGSTALALTDHGTMSGSVQHYEACRKFGIKPILGIEGYFQPVFHRPDDSPEAKLEARRLKKEGIKVRQDRGVHCTLLASSLKGYQNLSQMITHTTVKGKHYYRPIFDFETFELFHEDVILLSGCPAGIVPQLLVNNDPKIHKHLQHLIQIFGDNFYFEVMPHQFTFNDESDDLPTVSTRIINREVVKLARQYGRPCVMTTDSHYQRQEQYENYLCMQMSRGREWKSDYSHLYMPTEDEVRAWWSSFMKADPTPFIQQTIEIGDRCDINLSFSEMVPQIDWGEPSQDKLTDLAVSGLKKRGLWTKPYKQRMKYELDIILTKGFEDYFLLCYDIIQAAKKKKIALGYGRGSVCGSLLAYVIGLTNVDPLVFDTSFERFLRPDKTALPDIDMDFCSTRRGEIISYILQKFAGHSAQIAAFVYQQVRILVNPLSKVFEIPDDEKFAAITELTRVLEGGGALPMNEVGMVPYDSVIGASRTLKRIDEKYRMEFDGKTHGFIWHFVGLYRQFHHIGKHAAGVAITTDAVGKYTPVMLRGGISQTSYDLNSLKTLNVVKMDILGLQTATVVQEIEKRAGVKFNYDMLTDEETYQRFHVADTAGIFQFESRGAKAVLQQVKPDTIQELIACNALNRPAPLQLGLVDVYANGKQGKVNVSSLWEKYTQETYGTIIYQEQVMKICRELAQMDWPDIDKVMKNLRASGTGPDPLLDKFVEGAYHHSGIPRKAATKLYQTMTQYLFGKGHSSGYTLMSFYMMWLKVHYPVEFFFALIKFEGDDKMRMRHEQEAVRNGIVVVPPTINSDVGYRLVGDGEERYIERGLASIPKVGPKTAQAIVEERNASGEYDSQEDAVVRLPQRVLSSSVTTALEGVGAFNLDEESRINAAGELCKQLLRRRYA